MSEIEIIVNVRYVLSKIDPVWVAGYYRKYAELSDLLEQFDDDELIEQLGGIDQILENHPTAVQEHVANIQASHEEDGLDREG